MYPTRSVALLARALVAPMPIVQRRALFYFAVYGRWPSLRHPRRFTEKVNWRVLRDRRDIIATCCDKLAMREFVGQRAPMARLLWTGTDLDRLADHDLPQQWVLKPNHGSGAVHMGSGRPDPRQLSRVTSGWLDASPSFTVFGDWGYSQAERTLIVEERLGDGAEAPPDYKVFTFHGEPWMVQVDRNRFDGHRRRYYDLDWTPLEFRWGFPLADVEPAPSSLGEMLRLARVLCQDIDFLRADFYDIDGQTFLGELTPYPESGIRPHLPASVDIEMGELWTLPERDG